MTGPAAPPGALAHVRVLDLSRVVAGPWASQLLGDLGADVLKVERPGAGDDVRGYGPPWLPAGPGGEPGDAVYFLAANRNKRSVAIDLTRPEGQRLVRALAARCDVVLDNFKVGGLRRYGLDHASLRAEHPRLVTCSITGFGETGPAAARPGYDLLVQALGGLMSITGRPDGEEGGGPMKVGVPVSDLLTGLYAAAAILAALAHRDRSGEGQHIDLSLLDCQVACLANQGLSYLHTGVVPRRLGNAHPSVVPYQDVPTADGHMILAVGNDGQFARFCEVAGEPGWPADPRFATNAARVRHRDELLPLLRRVTARRTTREWVAALEAAGVPCGPVQDMAQVFADPQVRARGMAVRVTHPAAGEIPLVASPVRLSATPVQYRLAPPLLGQHTREVLEGVLGLDRAAVDELARQGIASVRE